MSESEIFDAHEKKQLEIEKLKSEIEKIKKEQFWIDEKQSIEIQKLKVETEKLTKEKGWKRLLVPSLIHIIPGIALVLTTIIIAQKQNLFKKQELENENTKTSIANARQALKIEQDIFELNKTKTKIEEDVSAYKLDSIRLKKSLDSVSLMYEIASIEKGEMSDEVKLLGKEKNRLTIKLKFLPFENYFADMREFDLDPEGTNYIIDEIIKVSDPKIKQILTDSLAAIKLDPRFKSLISFIQFRVFKKEIYFQEILTEVSTLARLNKTRNDQIADPYKSKDSSLLKELKRERALIFILEYSYDSLYKLKLIDHIVNLLWNNFSNNDFYIHLINIPRIQNLDLSLNLFEYNIELLFKYLQLNLLILENDGVSKMSLNSSGGLNVDISNLFKTVSRDSGSFEKTSYALNRDDYIRKNCLANLAIYCPQCFVAFTLKGYDFMFNLNINIDEQNYINLPFACNFQTFRTAVIEHQFKNNFSKTGSICDSIFSSVLPVNLNSYIPDSIKSVSLISTGALSSVAFQYGNAYSKYKTQCSRWLDVEMRYFRNNIDSFKVKIINKTF